MSNKLCVGKKWALCCKW